MAAVSAAAATGDDWLALLAHSWTQASRIYEEQLVPRFNPWTQDALAQLSHHALALPSGVCVVPCCGPGQELPLVAAALGPERTLIGSDLSPGMVEIASARAASVGLLLGAWGEHPFSFQMHSSIGHSWCNVHGGPGGALVRGNSDAGGRWGPTATPTVRVRRPWPADGARRCARARSSKQSRRRPGIHGLSCRLGRERGAKRKRGETVN
jgi:SAM-dependent methyltransferase